MVADLLYNVPMAGKRSEMTYRHRNIIDDLLDLGLLVLMVAWYFSGIEISEKTLAMLGGVGASARVSLRRILVRIWGEDLGINSEDQEGSELGDDDQKPPEGEDPSHGDPNETQDTEKEI